VSRLPVSRLGVGRAAQEEARHELDDGHAGDVTDTLELPDVDVIDMTQPAAR
jgi:hypothetical protein